MPRAIPLAAAMTVAALVLAGCGSSTTGAEPDRSADGVSVVATTTIWGDITRQVVECAGSGTVTTLMPVGADPHDFTPSSQDLVSLVSADLVVANGLGLEEGLEASLDSARQDGARILEVAPQLDPMPLSAAAGNDASTDSAAEADDHVGEAHSGDDPHVWLDVSRAADAAAVIGAELADVTGDEAFDTCGAQVRGDLQELDAEVAATLATVPPERRILVTDHDALEYFADAYGYTVAGTVVPGGSTLAEPSSAELAALAQTVEQAGVPAIFANTANPQALVEALAAEVGDVAVVDLYIGSLGPPGSGAETYAGMMTTNAQRISDALAG